MAHSGSRFHASRNDRTASGFANEYIIWKPWSKYACASFTFDDIGRVKVPRPFSKMPIGAEYRSNSVGGDGGWATADDVTASQANVVAAATQRRKVMAEM